MPPKTIAVRYHQEVISQFSAQLTHQGQSTMASNFQKLASEAKISKLFKSTEIEYPKPSHPPYYENTHFDQ